MAAGKGVGMGKLRFDHVGVVVDDLGAAIEFFRALGFEGDGTMVVEGDDVDGINGLEGVRAELIMMRAPDGSGTLELVQYHEPADGGAPSPASAHQPGYRHIAIEVDDVAAVLAGLREQGFDTVGEVRQYEGTWRLCYVRGPEGLIVELAQRLGTS